MLSLLFIKGIANDIKSIKSCARHEPGLMTMKKNILNLAVVAFTATVIGFCAAAASSSEVSAKVTPATVNHTHVHAEAQGKHCTGTVGCDCSGFSPITNGKEWQKSYCKKCGHSKSSHR